MSCKTAEELMALAKADDFEMTKEEEETYMAELEDFELDNKMLKQIAGGSRIPLKGQPYLYDKI